MDLDVETAHIGDGEKTPFQRWLAVLVGVAALSAALIATLEADAGRREERAFIRASRLSLDIFEGIAGSSQLFSFQGRALEQALSLGIEANGRALAAIGSPEIERVSLAQARAERIAARRLTAIFEEMTRLPGPEGGVDAHTREVLATGPEALQAVVEEQNAQVDAAERYGTRQDRSIFALSLVAIAAVLLGLAGVMGDRRGGRTALIAAGAALVVALGWGATALPV
jgi:hypothetical protein